MVLDEQFVVINKKNGEEVEIKEMMYIRLLQITYVRDYGLFELLVKKYEILTQKKFDISQIDYKKNDGR